MVRKKMIPLYVPFLPKTVAEEVNKTLNSGWINEGPKVKEFEELFAKRFNFRHALAVNSCTSALRLAYAIAGVSVGDEVITTPHTMMATNTAIMEQGAKPIFADIQYETGNIDWRDAERRITKRTKAIAVVHVAGYPCDMKEFLILGKEYNLPIIEDCAHAVGAQYAGDYIGSFSDFACFSFHTCKHITTGDGGMFVTFHDEYAEKAKSRRWYGIDRDKRFAPSILGYADYDVTQLGYKYNMNDIAGTIGVEQMKYINIPIRRRMEIAEFYRDELEKVKGITLMEWKNDRVSANWLFPIHVDRRIKFCEMMQKNKIAISIAFKRNDIYTIFGGLRNDLPNMDKFDKDIICIPIHCSLTDKDVQYIIEKIKHGW